MASIYKPPGGGAPFPSQQNINDACLDLNRVKALVGGGAYEVGDITRDWLARTYPQATEQLREWNVYIAHMKLHGRKCYDIISYMIQTAIATDVPVQLTFAQAPSWGATVDYTTHPTTICVSGPVVPP